MATSLWKWWLGVGGTGVLLYVLLPGSTISDLAYIAFSLSAPIAIAVGVRWFRPAPRAPWLWVAGAHLLWWSADVAWFVLD